MNGSGDESENDETWSESDETWSVSDEKTWTWSDVENPKNRHRKKPKDEQKKQVHE